PHPRPAQPAAKLAGTVALSRRGAHRVGDQRLALGDRGALGADPNNNLNNRAGLSRVTAGNTGQKQKTKNTNLAAHRQTKPLRTHVTIPSPHEAGKTDTAPVSMGGEHGTDAAVAVYVGADDDPIGVDAAKHRLLDAGGHGVDGEAQPLGRISIAASH